jgi:hypothetical protein
MGGQVFVLTVEASGEVTPAPEPEADEPSDEEELSDG